MTVKPTVGRIVHYRLGPNTAPQAAIITHVWPGVTDRVNLAVFSANAVVSCASDVPPVPEAPRLDSWSWPPRANRTTRRPGVDDRDSDPRDGGDGGE